MQLGNSPTVRPATEANVVTKSRSLELMPSRILFAEPKFGYELMMIVLHQALIPQNPLLNQHLW